MTTRDYMARWMLLPAMCVLILSVPALAQHQLSITTINAPVAGGSNGYGTQVMAINPSGWATGYYVAYDNVVHAYVRTPDGQFTPINGPGVPWSALNDPYSPPITWIDLNAPGTYGAAISARGTVTGYYIDEYKVAHGYLRTLDGTFTKIEAKDAGNEAGQGTVEKPRVRSAGPALPVSAVDSACELGYGPSRQ